MAGYKKPSRLNIVSLTLLLGILAGIYTIIQYGPPYWREYKVKEVLDEIANRCRGNLVPDNERLDAFEEEAEKKIHAAGVKDSGLRVHISIGAHKVSISATYREVVRHWFVKKVSTLSFSPEISRERLTPF